MESGEKIPGILIDRVDVIRCAKCDCEIDTSDVLPFVDVQCPDCGHVAPVPAKLGDFLLLRLLGTGGMGGVYYAKDETLGRFVAIKVMLEALGEDAEFVETFRREAQAAAQLNHPHIAQIYSFGQEKGQPYIVMELVPGKGLDKLMQRGKPLDQWFVLGLGLDIAAGLQAADEIGLVHGDIKPENILLDEKRQAKLVDFGIATFTTQASQGGIWGTPYYISPEKITRQKLGAHSDIYSLGATLYHALAGQPPFDGETPVEVVKARLEHDPAPLHELRPDIDPAVEKIVMRMLLRDPTMRYPTYASLLSDMRKALQKVKPDAGFTTAAAGPGKKVVIKKKRPMTVTQTDSSGENGQEAVAEPGQPVKAKTGLKVFLWLLLILAVVGGGIGLWAHLAAKKKAGIEMRRQLYALEEHRRQANALFGPIGPMADTIQREAETAMGYAVSATNAVQIVTGERFEFPEEVSEELTPDEPPPDEAVTAGEDATNAQAAVVDEGGSSTNVPADGVEPLPEPAVAETPAPAPLAIDEPEIVVLAREVVARGREVVKLAAAADTARARAEDARKAVLGSRLVEEAGTQVEVIRALGSEVKGLASDAKRILRDTEEAHRKVEMLKTRVVEDQTKQQRRDREEAALRAEEDAARRRNEQRQALIESEISKARAARDDVKSLVKQHKYEEAFRTLNARSLSFETAEGREEFGTLVERYERLYKLKLFIVEGLNAEPFSWGWGWGAQSTDVLGADEFVIKIKGRSVPWPEVSAAQMMKFIRNYLAKRDVGLREMGQQNLNAAIFCREFVGGEAADRAAREFSEKAVDLLPNLAEDVDRLLRSD